MSSPTFFSDGHTPNKTDPIWVILQKILGALTDIGSSGQFVSRTTAQLNAMSSADASSLRYAYATDALDISRVYGSTGACCFYNGSAWLYLSGGFPIATTFYQLALNNARYASIGNNVTPSPMICASLVTVGANSGTGSATGTARSPSVGGLSENTSTTGTSSSGIGGLRSLIFPSASTDALARAQAIVINHVTADQSAAPDTFQIRNTIETGGAGSTAAAQTDMFGFVYDESNILTYGSTGSNFYALIRGNSTNNTFVDTGLARTTPDRKSTRLNSSHT